MTLNLYYYTLSSPNTYPTVLSITIIKLGLHLALSLPHKSTVLLFQNNVRKISNFSLSTSRWIQVIT